MNFSELKRVIDQLCKDRGIKREVLINAIESAFVVAARKKFGLQGDFEARYVEEEDDVEIYQYKNVVQELRDPTTEITMDDARQLDENCELGDQLGLKIENPGFTRVDVQTAKQVLFQKVRDAEREILFKEFKHREGELITGIARRSERGNMIVDLGKADAVLSRREVIPGENFRPGDRIQAYLSEVVMTNRGPEIRLSRTCPMFLVKLFAMEVPEIQDGTIEVKSAAREPGQRAKVAVYTHDRDIDPVGASVGMKGGRVQNIVNELQGEKIDVVKWSPDIEQFAKEALRPSEITSIMTNSEQKSMDIIVEDDQLSLAIGKRGQNVRLAAMLTGWRINIISKTKLQDKIKKSVENLVQLSTINPALAQVLVHEGVMCIADLKNIPAEQIARLGNLDISVAQKVLDQVTSVCSDEASAPTVKLTLEEDVDIVSACALPSNTGIVQKERESNNNAPSTNDKFSQVEKRLREELAAFKLK